MEYGLSTTLNRLLYEYDIMFLLEESNIIRALFELEISRLRVLGRCVRGNCR